MDNNIKELIEAVLSDQMDEDATISHKHTNITQFQSNLMNLLITQFSKIKHQLFISNASITGTNEILHVDSTVSLTKNIGWSTGLILEQALNDVIKDAYTVTNIKIGNDKNGQPIKDFTLTDKKLGISQQVQVKCIQKKNYNRNSIMNSNIKDNNDLGIIIIYHFNTNKFNNIDIYIDTIFVFCCEIDNNGQKNFKYLAKDRTNKAGITIKYNTLGGIKGHEKDAMFIIDIT